MFLLAAVLSFKSPLLCVKRERRVKMIGLRLPGRVWWLLHGEEEEAGLRSVLSGEVEQPLAQ